MLRVRDGEKLECLARRDSSAGPRPDQRQHAEELAVAFAAHDVQIAAETTPLPSRVEPFVREKRGAPDAVLVQPVPCRLEGSKFVTLGDQSQSHVGSYGGTPARRRRRAIEICPRPFAAERLIRPRRDSKILA